MKQKQNLVLMIIGALLFMVAFYCLDNGRISLRGTIFDSESPIFFAVITLDLVLATICFGFGMHGHLRKPE